MGGRDGGGRGEIEEWREGLRKHTCTYYTRRKAAKQVSRQLHSHVHCRGDVERQEIYVACRANHRPCSNKLAYLYIHVYTSTRRSVCTMYNCVCGTLQTRV